jgi:hypothetical protein
MKGLCLPTVIAPLANMAADGDGRYALNGVQVQDNCDGTFRCTATDGRYMMIAQGYCPEKGELGTTADFAVTVPTSVWEEAFRKTKLTVARTNYSYGPKSQPYAEFEFSGDPKDLDRCSIKITTDGRTFSAPPVDGRYPDWQAVLPKGQPKFAIRVCPGYLADILRTASRMLPAEHQAVVLCFWDSEAPLAVVAKNPETGLTLDSILMPLTPFTPIDKVGEEPEQEDEEACAEWHCRNCKHKAYDYEFENPETGNMGCPMCGSDNVEEITPPDPNQPELPTDEGSGVPEEQAFGARVDR